MKFADINKRYTEIVAGYFAQGYTVNTATMAGSQGEVAKIDMTNGLEIIRIYLDRFSEWGDLYTVDGYEIVIGKSTDNVPADTDDRYGTVWSSRLEVTHKERFYAVGRDKQYFTGMDEAIAASRLQTSRYVVKHNSRKSVNLTNNAKAMEVAKRIIRKQFGVKRIIESDVKIARCNNRYVVSYRGRAYGLH